MVYSLSADIVYVCSACNNEFVDRYRAPSYWPWVCGCPVHGCLKKNHMSGCSKEESYMWELSLSITSACLAHLLVSILTSDCRGITPCSTNRRWWCTERDRDRGWWMLRCKRGYFLHNQSHDQSAWGEIPCHTKSHNHTKTIWNEKKLEWKALWSNLSNALHIHPHAPRSDQ